MLCWHKLPLKKLTNFCLNELKSYKKYLIY